MVSAKIPADLRWLWRTQERIPYVLPSAQGGSPKLNRVTLPLCARMISRQVRGGFHESYSYWDCFDGSAAFNQPASCTDGGPAHSFCFGSICLYGGKYANASRRIHRFSHLPRPPLETQHGRPQSQCTVACQSGLR